jgi:hypothetical protein
MSQKFSFIIIVEPNGSLSSKVFKKENAPAMKAAKADSNEIYSKYQKKTKRFADGGSSYDESFQDPASW